MGALGTLVAGIDVGSAAKGFHAVAMRGNEVLAKTASANAVNIATWCKQVGVEVVAVDAPSCWRRKKDPARLAERQLAAERVSCFSTPTEEQARGHAFYTWMLAGAELFAALQPQYPLYTGLHTKGPISIETFPQAVACALAGQLVSAKQKKAIRSSLLRATGMDISSIAGIDEIDAALCANAADSFSRGSFKAYGDSSGGFIIVPSKPLDLVPTLSFVNASKSAALTRIFRELPKLNAEEQAELRARLKG